MDLAPHNQTAIAAAYKAAEILRARFGNISHVRKKDAVEIVTEADTEAEKEIITTIRSRFPEHSILGEESGLNDGANDFRWVIDPLDGTVNFAHQVPIFCISIALVHRDEIVLGVILNPVDGQLYTAQRGQGAHLNGQPIQVSKVKAVADSLLVTGFPYHILEIFEPVIIRYGNCLKASQAVRRLGSAALDLCYVACGRFEAFWEQGLKAWDTAAGALIAGEAGASVTTFSNEPYNLGDHEILVSNGHIHQEMLELLRL
ncbi:Inositol-1-monophosphatase (EC [Olavius algarvensis Delta 1 endosymbiont]|nr:Inositol-1-monophosphatase (EC [Olavius algarvensis Delta 1 endosymbiont]